MHQEAADELACIERHHPVVSLGAIKAIVLPLEGDALVVGRDQAAVGDGDAVGVARKIAQDLLRSPKWTLGIDDPVFVAQRCQISREGFWIGQRHVHAEELQLSGTMSGSKLFQDKPSPQVCKTERIPMRAPRCLGSDAMVSIVSAEALNRMP